MRGLIASLALLMALAAPARAEEIVLGLSSDEVAITATFDGSNILIFGAIRRDEPPPEDSDLGVVVTVSGPVTPLVVRRKARRFGVWINTDAARISAAPSFYAVATTGPFEEVLSHTEDLRHSVSIPRAIRAFGNEVPDADAFVEALIRIRQEDGHYHMMIGDVVLARDSLFSTQIALPADLVEGFYPTRIFLTRDGEVVDIYRASIAVRKVGLERWLYNLAHDQPLAYGLLAIALAIVSGWLASVAFQLVRR